MSSTTIIESTFQEELYAIPAQVVVAISTPWSSISEAEKVLLDKILGAVKLSINHVKVMHATQLDVLKWIDRPSHVLAFGLELTGFNTYEPFDVQGIKVILAPTLSALENDKDGKAKLWAGLKKVFA